MALPPFDFLTSAPIDQLGTSLGKDFDYLGAYRSGRGIRNDIDYSNQPMIQVMPPPFTIGDNPDVIKDMNLPDYMNFQKYMRERGAADLINPQNQVPIKDVGSDSTGIGEIILPPIAGGGGGGGGGGGVEGPINYNNLIVRDQSTGTGIDSNVPAITGSYNITPVTKEEFEKNIGLKSRFENYNDYFQQTIADGQFNLQNQTKKTGILEGLKTKGNALLDFIKKGGVIGNIASELLPEQDPRATALRDFYGDNFGLTSSGSVASGIMQNYNPVSGGFLNLISGGKYGDETQYGLGEAIDERMDNIKDMLGSKYNYNYTNDSQMYKDMIAGKIGKYGVKGHTSAAENYFKLKSLKEKEALALKEAQEKVKEKEYQERITEEANTAARARAANAAVYASADRQGFTNDRGGFSTSAADKAGTSEGSGQGFSNKSGKGRTGYGKGGIVTL